MKHLRPSTALTALAKLSRGGRPGPPRGWWRGTALTAAGLAVCAGVLAFSAAPAFAYSPRTYEFQFSAGPSQHEWIAIDSDNRIWTSEDDFTDAYINEFNALGEKLPTQITIGGYPRLEGSIAADHSNNDLYVPNSFGVGVEAFSASGTLLAEKSFAKPGQRVAIAVDNSAGPTAGRLYLALRPQEGSEPSDDIELLNETGGEVLFSGTAPYINGNKLTGTPAGHFTSPGSVAVGPHGEIYVADTHAVDEFESSGEFLREVSGSEAPGTEFVPGSIAVDPTNGDLLAAVGSVIDEFAPGLSGGYLGQVKGTGPAEETPFGGVADIAVNSVGYLYVLASGTDVDVFSPSVILPKVTYPGISGGTESSPGEGSATLNAEIHPDGGGEVTSCKFEYVEATSYKPSAANPFEVAKSAACEQALPYSGTAPAKVSAEVSGLATHTVYRYRVLVGNANGTTEALPQSFDLQEPSVTGVSSSNLTETTAELTANINPEGGDTTYEFEYGPSVNYGNRQPIPAADIGSFDSPQSVTVQLTGLEAGVVYHYRLVARNPFGTVVSEDYSFNFFPPSCPNAALRQQTGTSFLPDCRAYELVSPGDAGGTILFPEGPESPFATQPSRFAFGGILGEIPEAGGEPPDKNGDLYVATRTATGWTTRYVGPPATQTLVVDGPPNEDGYIQDDPAGVLADRNMDQFLDWDDPYTGVATNSEPPESYAPYLRGAEGQFFGRLPTNLGAVPGGEKVGELLRGGVKPSPEFNHYFFSSTAQFAFAPGALTHEPGSAYDDNLEENTVELISKLPNGRPIEEGGGEFIAFPGVSTDGSHILMSTGYSCASDCNPNYDYQGTPFSGGQYRVNAERHLFMRVGGGQGVTYEIAPGHGVHYVGMTADGSTVYFTSSEKLTSEAEDTSSNLYMWSEKGELDGKPLTLISKPNGSDATGTPVCPATNWTTECGAVPFLTVPSRFLPDSIIHGGPGGNGLSDNFIAAENGDIYFYSPQQLDGTKGTLGQQNLYDYRGGKVQYVTTLSTGPFCESSSNCSEGPVVRIQVSANDSHMAFLTASPITSYDNAGHLEMYTYDPTTEGVHCVSCLPNGAPPTSNVEASDNGLFMTEDGRVFFSTADPLVPQDTDGIRDVYEYVDGRAQLISSGTSSREIGVAVTRPPGLDRAGLVGVSANGTDAYFSTFDTLVSRDRNGGAALKFYDARTDGGFAEPPAPAPCAAAEECAGAGSSPPADIQNGTGAVLGGLGNLGRSENSKEKRHHKKKRSREKKHDKKKQDRHRRRTGADRGTGK